MTHVKHFLRLLALALALHHPAHAQGWSLKIQALARDGANVTTAILTVERAGVSLAEGVKVGDAFPAGVVLVTPARFTVTLQSTNGNTVRMLPGTRLRVAAGSGRGEEYGLEEGGLSCIVKRALEFFNVRHENFQAIVRGTRYTVAVDPHKEIRYGVTEGRVMIRHEAMIGVEEGRKEGAIAVAETLEAGQTRAYRLDLNAYLAKFKHFGEVQAFYRKALEEDRASGDPDRLIQGLSRMGCALRVLSHYQEALPYLEESLRLVRLRHPGGVHNDVAAACDNLGLAHLAKDGAEPLAQAIRCFQEARDIRGELFPGGIHDDLAQTLNNLGACYVRLGGAANLRKAIAYFEDALRIRRALHGGEPNEGLAGVLSNLGNAFADLGDRSGLERAAANYEEALAIRRKLFPDGVSLTLAHSLLNLGGAYQNLGGPENLARSVALCEEALTLYRRIFPTGPQDDVASALDDLGLSLYKLGGPERFERASACFQESLAIRRKLFPDGIQIGIALTLTNLGNVYGIQGGTENLERATVRFEEALAIYRKLFPDGQHDDIAALLNNLATVHSLIGGPDHVRQSVACYEEALKLFRQRFPGGHASMAPVLGSLALDHLFLGNPAVALRETQEALAITPGEVWILIVQSHALILLNREEEAKAILLPHRGEELFGRPFGEAVAGDYEALRKAGVDHPGFKRMEALLGTKGPAAH